MQLKGNKLGEYTMAATVIPIMAFTVLFGELVALFAVTATILGFAVGQCFVKYRFTRRKSHLAWTIGIAIVTVLCIAFLIANSLEWWLR
jgi:heme/copper-type cytochrome/quinol oxidase subunit 4